MCLLVFRFAQIFMMETIETFLFKSISYIYIYTNIYKQWKTNEFVSKDATIGHKKKKKKKKGLVQEDTKISSHAFFK